MSYRDGKWIVIKNATVGADGKSLTFTTDVMAPFAIVINDTDAQVPSSPQTGDALAWALLAGIFVFGSSATYFFIKSKKRSH